MDVAGTLFDSTIPYDPRFFEALHRIVQLEPWFERDRMMINTLASLGIRKGQPFAPDEATRAAFTARLADARAFLTNLYEAYPPYYPGGHWFLPYDEDLHKGLDTGYADRDSYPIDARHPLLRGLQQRETCRFGAVLSLRFTRRVLGQRPITAFGNSDGDYEMLEYVTTRSGRRLGIIVHHDDAAREYAYDRQSHIGRLDRGLADAGRQGWHLASMRDDWAQVFPAD